MSLSVKLEAFEGPLDLLLHLIDKNKVDIYDIPISEITNQYMEYIQAMEDQDMNIMSEFLLMAATLLDIKCRMLLPKEINEDGEEEDPRAELVERLIQYKMYKYMSYELKDRQVDGEKILYREPSIPKEVMDYQEPVNLDLLLKDLSMQKLNKIYQDILKRQVSLRDPIRSKFGTIEREEVSLPDKMDHVKHFAMNNRKFSFRKLLENQRSKMHTIVTFLAILELMKDGSLEIVQENIFDDIIITSKICEI